MGSRNRDRMMPVRPTLGDVVWLDGYLIGYCGDCTHQRVLPLTPLLERFGKSGLVGDIGAALVCKFCGSKDVRIEVKVSR